MQARIDSVDPAAALPAAEVRLRGSGLMGVNPPRVTISGAPASIVVGADSMLQVRVPDEAVSGLVAVDSDQPPAGGANLEVGVMIGENLHPVCNPALDAEGNVFVTLSGSRGQKTPVSIFRLDANHALRPWSSAITNPSGLAFDRAGTLFASSRHDGAVYRLTPNGAATLYCEGLGIATGIAFDPAGNLYAGDRSGTIFKIDGDRNIFVFATLDPSVAAYHLAFGTDGFLYVSGPSTSSYDAVWRISPRGVVEPFFRGLGRPQGLAFDRDGSLYVVASHRGRRGVIRIGAEHKAELVVSGLGLVGLAFAPGPAMILASTSSLFYLPWAVPGLPLPSHL